MKIFAKTLFVGAAASLCSTSMAQVPLSQEEETCSTGMTEFASTPQEFESILINPTCTSGSMFITSQLAWTIEPTEDTVSRIYSYPPEAVIASLEDNLLVFDLNDMGEVPDKAGVVIKVPHAQLINITVDGIFNYVRVARGFSNLMTLSSLGTSSIIQADLYDSLYSSFIVDASNSIHEVTADDLSLQMYSVSSKVLITGSVMSGEYSGFNNELLVNGTVSDLSVSGNRNTLASSDCSSVVVNSNSSSCTAIEEMARVDFPFPSIPCTFPGCEMSCVSTNFGSCSCTEAECEGANSPMDEMNGVLQGGDGSSSAGSCIGTGVIVAALLAVTTLL